MLAVIMDVVFVSFSALLKGPTWICFIATVYGVHVPRGPSGVTSSNDFFDNHYLAVA